MTKVMFLLAMLSLGTLCWAGTAREDATDRLDNATNVLHEIMGMPDNGIPEEVLEHAKCVAVVPHMVKAGFVFGGKGGKGVATCRTANGWSAPAFITISGGSWGLQIGVEAVDLVMIIQNEKGMQKLLSSNFQLGADASAAAGPVGRHARALLLGKVPAPSAAQPFLAAIRGAKAQAVAGGKAEPKSEAKSDARSEAKENVTVTGCLQKGDDADEFSIIGKDGSTWGLHSTNVKLDKHLGHTVTVAGSRTHKSKAQEKAEEKKEGQVEKASSKEEYADLSVTSLQMVSQTCSK